MRFDTVGMGRLVYMTDSKNVRVHDTPECRQLAIAQAQRRYPRPVKAVDLETIQAPKLCKRCWPEAPRAKVRHVQCTKCGHHRPMPCPHNGGIEVLLTNHKGWTWVWPENAHHYTLANPEQLH